MEEARTGSPRPCCSCPGAAAALRNVSSTSLSGVKTNTGPSPEDASANTHARSEITSPTGKGALSFEPFLLCKRLGSRLVTHARAEDVLLFHTWESAQGLHPRANQLYRCSERKSHLAPDVQLNAECIDKDAGDSGAEIRLVTVTKAIPARAAFKKTTERHGSQSSGRTAGTYLPVAPPSRNTLSATGARSASSHVLRAHAHPAARCQHVRWPQ